MLSLNEASGSSRRLKVCEGNLALLREKLVADPESYAAEFGEQFEHFQQHMKLLELQPKLHRASVDVILQLTGFLSAVASHYPDKSAQLGATALNALQTQAPQMDSELRMALCKCLVRLTNGRVVDQQRTVALLFELLRCDDKALRKFILAAVVSFVRRCTKGVAKTTKRKRLRRKKAKLGGTLAQQQSTKLQQTLFAMLNNSRAVCARVAQMALMEAYRKQYWREPKTANALAECVFHRVQRIQVSTMRFFLGTSRDEQNGEESSDEEEESGGKQDSKTLKEVLQQFRHAKKTKKRQKEVQRTKKEIFREKKSKKENSAKHCNLEAIRSIYDPQRFADRLFGALDCRRNEKYAIRLLQIALCARVIGVHRLQTLGFYSYLHRYLQPKQKEVTRILLYAAQACHELVPPDCVEQLVRVVAQNFVSDRCTPEAITVGLNTIREIYANCPSAATEEMIRDLAEYKRMHNKNVSMAARALVTLFRTLNPKLLHHKDRGRPTTSGGETLRDDSAKEFGAIHALDYVPGAEMLPEDEADAERLAKTLHSSDDEEEWMDMEDEEENATKHADELEEDEVDDVECTENEEDGWESASSGDDDGEEEEEWGEEGADEGEYGEGEGQEWTKSSPKKKHKSEEQRLKKTKGARSRKTALARAEELERAKQISASRILTDADFRLIRIKQLRLQAGLEKGSTRKRTNDELQLAEEVQQKLARTEVGDGLPRLNDIEHFHKKMRRQTKQERLEQVQQGRPEREEYGKPKKGAHVGRTNRELAKRKNFQMVRHKVRGKNRQRSFRDRQISLRNYLLRQQGKKV